MAMDINGIAGPQTYSDGAKNLPRLDRTGSLLVMEGGGKWQELAARGLLYTFSTAVGGVNIPVNTSTTQQFVLYNPVGNTKAAVLKSATLGYVSGTPVIGHTCYVVQSSAQVTSWAAPTGTASSPVNHKTLTPAGSSMSCLTAATVVAGTYFRPAFSVYTTTAGQPGLFLREDFDGAIIVGPGTWIAVAANAAAFGTHAVAIEFAEVPLSWVNWPS